MSTINIPQRNADKSKLLGKNVLLYVNAGEGATVENPRFLLVGGQRNSGLEISADEIDLSDKESDGWGDSEQGRKNWSISLETISIMGDEGIAAIKQACTNSQEIQVMRWAKGGNAEVGWCVVLEYNDDVPHDGEATVTGTLKGRRAPIFLTGVEQPTGVNALTAIAGEESVKLNWAAISDAKSIKAQYSTNQLNWTDSPAIIQKTDSFTTITSLLANTQYYFRLVVIGGSKTGHSNVATATPNAKTK